MEGSALLEDIFENELYWLFLVGNRPNEVTVADIENSQEIIKELLQKKLSFNHSNTNAASL